MRLNIKDKMAEKGLNKNQLAKLTQINYPNICKIYDGETTNIRFETMEALCRVLECTPNEILVSDDPQLNRLMAYSIRLKELNNKGDSK